MPITNLPDDYSPEAVNWLERALQWEQSFDRLRSPRVDQAPVENLPEELDEAA